jgi:hypothetical protein
VVLFQHRKSSPLICKYKMYCSNWPHLGYYIWSIELNFGNLSHLIHLITYHKQMLYISHRDLLQSFFIFHLLSIQIPWSCFYVLALCESGRGGGNVLAALSWLTLNMMGNHSSETSPIQPSSTHCPHIQKLDQHYQSITAKT